MCVWVDGWMDGCGGGGCGCVCVCVRVCCVIIYIEHHNKSTICFAYLFIIVADEFSLGSLLCFNQLQPKFR